MKKTPVRVTIVCHNTNCPISVRIKSVCKISQITDNAFLDQREPKGSRCQCRLHLHKIVSPKPSDCTFKAFPYFRNEMFGFFLKALTLAIICDVSLFADSAAGRQLYLQNCFICHQLDGRGIPATYPP